MAAAFFQISLLVAFMVPLLSAQEMPTSLLLQLEEYNRELQAAAIEVLASDAPMDTPPAYPDDGPVPFDTPSNFMHSFRPNTGVGNREELVIEEIVEVPLFEDQRFSKWRYLRFNNSDYFLAFEKTKVALWKKYINATETVEFSVYDSIFRQSSDTAGAIADAFMFVRKIRNVDVLYLAIFTSGYSDVISIFEIVDNKGEMVTVIDLGFKAFVVEPSSLLAYVESRHVGILAVLVSNALGEGIVYQKKSSTELNHYLEIHLPSAVDLVSFSAYGHGYVAVANRSVCIIYKLGEFAHTHVIFDRIYFEEDIVDLEHFSLGYQKYLVISSANYQALYEWRIGGFYRTQDFNSSKVNQAFGLLLASCRDDVILMFIKDKFPDLFVWSGQEQKFLSVNTDAATDFLPVAGSMTSFSYGNYGYILFVNKYGMSGVVAMQTRLDPVPDPVLLIGKEVADLMKQLQETITEQERAIHSMNAVLANAVRPYGDQTFSAPQVFADLEARHETVANLLVSHENIRWQGSSLTLAEYLAGTDDSEQRIDELEKELDALERFLEDVVLVDEDAVITGRKTFLGEVHGSVINAHSLNVEMVGGINLPELQKQIYRLDKPSTILGVLSFEKPLTILGNLDVYGTINGIDFRRDVMTTNTDQRSNASMVFHNKVTVLGDLSLSGKLNGIDIGTEVVTLGGDHVITGKKTFSGGIVADTVFANFIDGVDMDRFFNKALTVTGDQTITGTKYFSGTLHTKDINLSGTLNGYDIVSLANSIVRTDVPAEITGHKTFHNDVVIRSSLTVGGTINGLRIPDDLFLLNRVNTVIGHKTFTGTVTANEVTVAGTVNGISIPSDIVTLSRDEEINATFYFREGITVNEDIVVHGLVDGVDVSELARQALMINEVPFIENLVFEGPVHIAGNLNVLGTVNGINFNSLVNDIVYRDEQDVTIQAPKTFTKLTSSSVSVSGKINGYNILTDFVTVSGNQEIYGTTVFKKPVTFQDITVANGMIAGVNIEQLYQNLVSLSIEDQTGDLEFVDTLIVDNLSVHGTIGGLFFPHDFVLKSSDQEISNKVFYGKVGVHQLHVAGHITVTDTFGNVRLPEFAEQRVTLSTDQEIFGDLVLGNVSAIQVDVHGPINGLDINQFAENVMSLTKDQQIFAHKEFTGTTTVKGPVTTAQGINGVNLTEVDRRAFKLRGTVTVEAPMTFADPLAFADLEVSGLINGVNITRLNEDSVKKTGEQHIYGETVFHEGFHVYGDIHASSVNGLYLPRDILTKSTEQTITGNFVFDRATIQGNLEVDGLVNGVDLSKTVPNLARVDQPNVIRSGVQFLSPVSVLGDLEVTGLVNGVDLRQLQLSILQSSGEQRVPGHKVLRGNVTVHGDVVLELVNGVHWAAFLDELVRVDVPQFITGKKYVVDGLEVSGDIYVSGRADVARVNGVDLVQFERDAVFVDQPANITGTKVFSNAVEIAGDLHAELINGLRLKTDVVTLQCGDADPQVISGAKTFQNLVVYGDIFVEDTVNGYTLYDLEANTLKIDDAQVVTGEKTFHKPITFLKNVYPTTVNGLVLHQELVTLDTDQVVSGPLSFMGNVHINGDLQLSGLLNGVDLVALANNALYVDTVQDIEGFYTIERMTAISPVLVEGTVNGMHLSKFAKTVSNFWAQKRSDLASLRGRIDQQCEIIRNLHYQLENSYYVLDGFLYHQTLNTSADYIEADPFGRGINLVKVATSRRTAESARYQWQLGRFELISMEDSAVLRQKRFTFAQHDLSIQIMVVLEHSAVSLDGVPVTSIPRGFSDADAIVHGKRSLVAVLFSDKSILEIIELVAGEEVHVTTTGVLKIDGATSLSLFEMSGVAYLAVSCDFSPDFMRGSSKIYAWDHNAWQLVQNVSPSASSRVTHFGFRGYHYLAFSNAVPVYESREPQAIQIYRNTERPEGTKFVLFQKLPFDSAKIVDVFEFGSLPDLYLVAANRTKIQVFALEGEAGFRTNYTIPGACVTAASAIVLDTELFLVVGQNDRECAPAHTTIVYKGLTQGSIVPRRKLTPCS